MSDARPLILYVDDEEANRQTFRFLYEEQLRVAVASSGEEALARLDELDPAVLVADQRMPGMSGSELCAQVRMRKPDTLRIILTAYADVNAAVDAINRGAVHAYFHKPYNEEELRNRLSDAVALFVARREVAALEERLIRDVPERVARAMAAEIAHELGNVLTGLGLSAQVLGDELTKIRASSAAGMPGPSSITWIAISWPASSTTSSISPSSRSLRSIACAALSTTLMSTCPSALAAIGTVASLSPRSTIAHA